jgi:RNA polymerase sigma-70 factor (ECF subfamily)
VVGEGRVSSSSFHAKGKAAYPPIALEPARFDAHLEHCRAQLSDSERDVDDLCVEDLYLACACLHKVPNAHEVFGRAYGKVIRAAVERISPSRAFQDDVEQRLLEQLLMGRPDGRPKIGAYTGYGSLARWVSVVAKREALMLLRSDAVEARARDNAALMVLAASPDPEVAFAKAHYRPAFETALADALRGLSHRDRVVLHLHLLAGAGVVQIAKMYSVAPSTASRWLVSIRETVSGEVRRLLATRLQLPPDELESLTALMMSQLDVSISRVLA